MVMRAHVRTGSELDTSCFFDCTMTEFACSKRRRKVASPRTRTHQVFIRMCPMICPSLDNLCPSRHMELFTGRTFPDVCIRMTNIIVK